jgi:hypothetical protein
MPTTRKTGHRDHKELTPRKYEPQIRWIFSNYLWEEIFEWVMSNGTENERWWWLIKEVKSRDLLDSSTANRGLHTTAQ